MPPKRMTANPVRPARYRPGKPTAPEHDDSDDDDDDDGSGSDADTSDAAEDSAQPAKKPIPAPALVSAALKKVDLNQRFEQSRKAEQERAAVAAAAEEEEEAQKAAAEAEAAAAEKSSSEYTSESESGSESEDDAPKPLLQRPTFIPKHQRHLVSTDPSGTAAAAAAQKEADAARAAAESTQLLEAHLRRGLEAKAAGRKAWDDDDDGTGLDDTDGLDPAAERAAWKLRELTRVQRERVALETIEAEREEVERRRTMDPELRRKEDLEYVTKQREEKKETRGQMGFLQKYYHKGAFYQDEGSGVSEVLARMKGDYATTPVEDQVKNREVLPRYMQVRGNEEVGKRGRTRWTHLADQDTSMQSGGSPWFEKSAGNRRAAEKMGGMRGDERFMPDPRRDGPGEDWRGGGRGEAQREAQRDGPGDDWRQKREEARRDRDKQPDFGDKKPPEGPRRDREGGGGGGRDRDRDRDRDRYIPNGPRPVHDRHTDRDRDQNRRRSRSPPPPRRRDDDRDRKRPRSPRRDRDEDHGDGDGDKRRRTEVPVG